MNWEIHCENDSSTSIVWSKMFSDELTIRDPILSLEINKISTFSFTIYPKNPAYNEIKRMSSIIKVLNDDELYFYGRVISENIGWNNEKEILCEGIASFLNDTIVRPFEFPSKDQEDSGQTDVKDYLEFLISQHNAKYLLHKDRQFTLGDVTVQDSNGKINRSDTEYSKTWDLINEGLIDKFGGYMFFTRKGDINYIDYYADINHISTKPNFSGKENQNIELGLNLLDISTTMNYSEIATHIIPLGARKEEVDEEGNPTENDGKRLTIESLEDQEVAGTTAWKIGDSVYVPFAEELYGIIEKTVIFDDITLAQNLMKRGAEYAEHSFMFPKVINIDAADISGAGYDVFSFYLGQKVNIYDKIHEDAHGLKKEYVIKSICIYIFSPEMTRISFEDTEQTFYGR